MLKENDATSRFGTEIANLRTRVSRGVLARMQRQHPVVLSLAPSSAFFDPGTTTCQLSVHKPQPLCAIQWDLSFFCRKRSNTTKMSTSSHQPRRSSAAGCPVHPRKRAGALAHSRPGDDDRECSWFRMLLASGPHAWIDFKLPSLCCFLLSQRCSPRLQGCKTHLQAGRHV